MTDLFTNEEGCSAAEARLLDASVLSVIWTVSRLNTRIAETLQRQLPPMWVLGEISGLTMASSGHAYFALKDSSAQLRCVMFRQRVQWSGVSLANGQQVEVFGVAGLYAARGECQFTVEAMRPAGEGMAHVALQTLKRRLAAEGLFDEDKKRALPAHPQVIGVVTSPQAAALHDVLTTLARRAPQIPVRIYPSVVQGDTAASSLAEAITRASRDALVSVLLLVRGGGSAEDLAAFNDESVARALAAAPMPTISGVGHETDTTLVDAVADVRAATPTAAAMLAAAETMTAQVSLTERQQRFVRAQQGYFLAKKSQLAEWSARHAAAWQRCYAVYAEAWQHRQARWKMLDPEMALRRGYALVTRPDGMPITAWQQVPERGELHLSWPEGQVVVEIKSRI